MTPLAQPAGGVRAAPQPPAGKARRGTKPAAGPAERTEDCDVLAARTREALTLALTFANRVTPEGIICPDCGKLAPIDSKFKIFDDGGYKHFSGAGCHGDAIGVVRATLRSMGLRDDFREAVNLLVGKKTRQQITRPDHVPAALGSNTFRAKVDIEVYNGVLIYGRKTGGLQAAQEFYGAWHISADAVEETGAVLIKDPKHFEENILKRFGEERLLACGLFVATDRGPRAMVSKNFPVVEPHRHPVTGDALYLQFRASDAQYQRYLDHKAGKRDYKGSEKFLSVRGAPREVQIGCGLPRINALPPGQTIFWVEGFKDLLAARTMGTEAYGVPGVDFRPNAKIIQVLSAHKNVIAFDGDAAGNTKRDGVRDEHGNLVTEGLVDYLRRSGMGEVYPYALPDTMDITDRLVEQHARNGCGCANCTRMRTRIGL